MSCEYYTVLQQRVDTDILSRRNSFTAGEFGTVDSLKVKVKVTQSCPTLRPHGLYSPWNSSGQNTGVDSLPLLQGIFQTQESNPVLPRCRQILYQLSSQGSPSPENKHMGEITRQVFCLYLCQTNCFPSVP